MEQQDKPKKAKNVGELMHHFVHGVFPTESRSNYWYEENKLYYGGTCIAVKLNYNSTPILLIWKDFDRRGSFGNGYNAWNIVRAASGVLKCIAIEDKYLLKNIDVSNITEEDKVTIILDWFYTEVLIPYIHIYADAVHLLETDSYNTSGRYNNPKYIESLDEFKNWGKATTIDIFEVSKKTIYNHIYNKSEWVTVAYKGWKAINSYVRVDKPVSFYLNQNAWFTEKENELLKFKKFKYDLLNKLRECDWSLNAAVYILQLNGGKTKTTVKDIYKNQEDTDKLLQAIEARKLQLDDIRARKAKKNAEERLKASFEKLELWLNGGKVSHLYLYYIPIHLRINDDDVETTLNATVPLKHAELLYKFFKKTVASDTPWHSNGHTFKIGHYKVEYINKLSDGSWCLKAGCHTIYEREIDYFVERNKLNWNDSKD